MSDEQLNEPEEQQAPTRAEIVREELASNAFLSIVPGLFVTLIASVMLFYQLTQVGTSSALLPVSIVLLIIGVGLIGFGIYKASQVKKVAVFKIDCPFCEKTNELTDEPKSDFRCVHCNREVPIENGVILAVFQVRCGFCDHLNFYSEKSTGLICEECDRAIPIATDEETHAKKIFENYTIHDDDHPYDLIINKAPNSEDMVKTLQTMLALNRNQVKDIIEDLPQTLLTGIPKKKAELLAAQISMHKGEAEIKMSETQ